MMKDKRILAIFILGLLLVSVFACAGPGAPGATPTPEPGAYLLFEIDYSYVDPGDWNEARLEMRGILSDRLRAHIQNPEVRSPDEHHISVFLPGAMDINQALDWIGNLEQLTLREQVDDEWVVAYAEGTDGRLRAFTGGYILQVIVWYSQGMVVIGGHGFAMLEQIGERNVGKNVCFYFEQSPILCFVASTTGENAILFERETAEEAQALAQRIEQAALPVSLIYVEGSVYPAPTPTFTPMPTLTPTPSGGLDILSSSPYYDGSGAYIIVGEVRNILDENMLWIRIDADYFDSRGTLIGESFCYAELEIVEPGQKTPFVLSFEPSEGAVASYKLSGAFEVTNQQRFHGLHFESLIGQVSGLGYKVTGVVHNSGPQAVWNVKVVATFCDSAGKVVAVDSEYAHDRNLLAGESSTFEVTTYRRHIYPASYSLEAQVD